MPFAHRRLLVILLPFFVAAVACSGDPTPVGPGGDDVPGVVDVGSGDSGEDSGDADDDTAPRPPPRRGRRDC